MKIKELFHREVDRRIEEVIKVDQQDDAILRDEIDEYILTAAIRKHFTNVLEVYREAPNRPTEGIAIWVSGFFGSGKSSFAKLLGLSIANRSVAGEPAGRRLASRAGDPRLQVLLSTINEKIPTHAVIFDVSTDRGIRSGNQTITQIMYGLFLQSLGYAKDLDLSELEIDLEERGDLARFETEYRKHYGKEWSGGRKLIAFALTEASRVMHEMDKATYPSADTWMKGHQGKADISPGRLAERCADLMKRRRPGHALMFVIDEVGQFVARDVQKMLDLQAVVQSLGRVGRGKHWVVVTSQEKLGELVSGLDDTKVELARLMDRFPSQVHLEPSDISEVTSRRVLEKNAAAQEALGKLFDQNRGRLTDYTRLTGEIRLPELTRESFIDLYPVLPYQIDLIIQVVSGLRTQGGASKHVGGANRTIIKLAQQLLINPGVALAERPLGELARLDHVYDLVEGNIGSDVRSKIASIARDVDHPMAQPVAKAICLLQFAKTVHRTADNVAAALHPGVDSDSQLPVVKEALARLEAAQKVRLGTDGYRIPTPAEDDWETNRVRLLPKPGDTHRLHGEVIAGFWEPAPSFTFLDTKLFRAGLFLHNREVEPGDMSFHVQLAENEKEYAALCAELRARSQQERRSVFWAVPLSNDIEQETRELFRSREMLSRKEREARTADETALIGEEKSRMRRHQDELKRLMKAAFLSGTVYFRGNDRSPGERATDVGKAASEILGKALPDVFDRFKEAAARVGKRDVEALGTSETLHGLTPAFAQLELLRDEKGKPVFRTEANPLAEIAARIEDRASYGESVSGRHLADELAKEPFGWDFDVVRLLVMCLLRAGKIEGTSKGQTLDSALSTLARETFGNNNLFKAATFRPRRGVEYPEVVKAAEAFSQTFGAEVRDMSAASAVASEVRERVALNEDPVVSALGLLNAEHLPGGAVLDEALGQMKAILRGTDDRIIGTFNAGHRSVKEAIKRAAELNQHLVEPRLLDLRRARQVLTVFWPFLREEPDLPETLRERAATLEDLLKRETFFRELPAIEQHATDLEREYQRRHVEARDARVNAYQKAFDTLVASPGWTEVSPEQQRRIAASLERGRSPKAEGVPIPQLRADRDACSSRLREAQAEILRVLEGERLVTLTIGGYFAGGIETEEQLDAALDGIREECAKLIGSGKKVLVQ